MAKTSDPEKKCENAPPDGVVKEGPEETAHGWPCLISLKRSSPWEEKESQKDSPGLKKKSEEIAASEQNTSKGKDRSLPCSNKKRKRKTCTTRLAGIEPKYIWMPLLIPVLFSIFIPGANGLTVQRRDFRKIIIGMNEVKMVTDPILTPADDSVYSVFARDGNDDREGFECTPDFVSTNPSCIIVVGDTSKAECEGLRISGNASYLAVIGSELTHDRTTYCIYQQVPEFFILYTLVVSKKREQDINECASNPCQNGGTCMDGLDSYICNCAKGYDGANCEIDINECASNPCQNGGACVDGLDSYTCNCAKGYYGANCEIDINECASNPCQNGGACVDGLDSYTCNCAKGYYGANCEIDIDECASSPCVNGGTCVDGHDSYTCNCAKGYDGADCEIGTAPETNHYEVALYIHLGIDVIILLVIVIRALWKKYIKKQEPTDDTESEPPSPTEVTTMMSEAERATSNEMNRRSH